MRRARLAVDHGSRLGAAPWRGQVHRADFAPSHRAGRRQRQVHCRHAIKSSRFARHVGAPSFPQRAPLRLAAPCRAEGGVGVRRTRPGLAAYGFTVARDGWRLEPVTGEMARFVCRERVTPDAPHLLDYEVFIEEIIDAPEPVVFAALLCRSDEVEDVSPPPLRHAPRARLAGGCGADGGAKTHRWSVKRCLRRHRGADRSVRA